MWYSAWHGFLLGLSLIVAIGAQNAFILKQGLKRQHVFWLCLFCALSDALLIAVGVFGFAQFSLFTAEGVLIAKYVGVIFLLCYGARHFYQAYRVKNQMLDAEQNGQSLLQLLAICFALTWLNPHVYLDTVILLGLIST